MNAKRLKTITAKYRVGQRVRTLRGEELRVARVDGGFSYLCDDGSDYSEDEICLPGLRTAVERRRERRPRHAK